MKGSYPLGRLMRGQGRSRRGKNYRQTRNKEKRIDRPQEENPSSRRKRSPVGNSLFGDVEDGRGLGPWKTKADYSGRWRSGSRRRGRRCTTVTCATSSGSSTTS